MTSVTHVEPPSRRHALRDRLLETVDLLNRRLAGRIAGSDIDDYVALQWLEWHGGCLRLTTTGENVCNQMRRSLSATGSRVRNPPN